MDTPLNTQLKLKDILLSKDFAKFGDTVINFIYNVAIYVATERLQGVKVWDKCLAEACNNSPLRSYLGSRKNKGDLGDAVEAFIGYLYLRKKVSTELLIDLLSRFFEQKKSLIAENEQKICAEGITYLINELCKKFEIESK
ncbi:MAG: ribonuclease III family protein [Candidatus Heimdallarchaeaceae archaeon]|jgi:dsRNA-specific ribonuclease